MAIKEIAEPFCSVSVEGLGWRTQAHLQLVLQYDLHAYVFGGGQYNTIPTHKGTFEFSFCRYKKKQIS